MKNPPDYLGEIAITWGAWTPKGMDLIITTPHQRLTIPPAQAVRIAQAIAWTNPGRIDATTITKIVAPSGDFEFLYTD